jgi:hypothetical protein
MASEYPGLVQAPEPRRGWGDQVDQRLTALEARVAELERAVRDGYLSLGPVELDRGAERPAPPGASS